MTDYETFKPVEPSEYYIKQIAAGLKKEIYNSLFKPIFEVLNTNSNSIYNDKKTLTNAIQSGRIYYENGAFRSNKPFSNAVADELEKLGAKYRNGAYYIDRAFLPLEVENALAIVAARETAKIAALNGLLARLAATVGQDTAVRSFIEKAVIGLFKNLETNLLKSTQGGKLPVIELIHTSKQARKISEDYIHNMDYWINKWKEQAIVKMRQDVSKLVQEGARVETIKKYFEDKNLAKDYKAEFLARNESGIASSVLKATHYQEMGCTHFKWLLSTAKEKRPLHLEYAKETGNQYGIGGTNIFSFADPPIIEQIEIKTEDGKKIAVPKPNGQKGLPRQTYNCLCNFVGIKNPQYYINRQKIENAKRNIFTKIKYTIENSMQRNNYPWRYRRFGEGQEV